MCDLFVAVFWTCFSDWDDSVTEDQAKKAYDKMLKIEEEFGDLFTGLPFIVFLFVFVKNFCNNAYSVNYQISGA